MIITKRGDVQPIVRIPIGCDYYCRVDLYCSVEDRTERGGREVRVGKR
jgi:hypothetical protein